MGFGGKLIITGVISEINKNLGKKVFLCYSPKLSDILIGKFYDSSRSLEYDEIFVGNPHVVTNIVCKKILALRLLDKLFDQILNYLKIKKRYEKIVEVLSNAIHRNKLYVYLHLDHFSNTYVKKQLPTRLVWKESINAVSGILENYGIQSDAQYSQLFFTSKEIENFSKKLRAKNLNRMVLIEPDSKGEWFGDLRKWEYESWQDVVYRFKIRYPNTNICQIGLSSSDLLDCVTDLRGFTRSFREACLLIKSADLFICTDGGLMHGARAVNTRTIVIWGGVNEPKFLGYPDDQIIIHKKVKCAPCGNFGWCDNEKICMREISSNEVFKVIVEQCEKLELV